MTRRLLIAGALLALAAGARATDLNLALRTNRSGFFGMTVPSTHPRLWYDASRLSAARTWYTANPFTPSGVDDTLALQRATRGLLNSGDPTDQATQCRGAITWALSTAATMAAESPPDAATPRDHTRWWGEAIIITYDWCYDHFTPAERATLLADTNDWLLWWITGATWGIPPQYQNNYYWGFIRNNLEWAIAVRDVDPTNAETAATDAITTRYTNDFLPKVLDADNGKGGAVQEGTQYGPYLVGYSVVPFTTAALLGRDLYGESNFWKEATYAIIYGTLMQSTLVQAQDAWRMWPQNDLNSEAVYRVSADTADFMSAIAQKWPSDTIGQHARQWLSTTGVLPRYHVRSVDPGGSSAAFSTLPFDYFSPGIRYLWGRSSWSAAATSFFLQGGDRHMQTPGQVGHAQVDWGSWQLWRGARFLSRETAGYTGNPNHQIHVLKDQGCPGACVLQDAAGPLAHNVAVVDGLYVASTYATATGVATAPRVQYDAAFSYMVADLTPTIKETATWDSYVREFVFFRGLETMVILDRIDSDSASAEKTFLVHCETDPVTDSTTDTATCTVGTQALSMWTLVPSGAAVTYGEVVEGGDMGQYRIEVYTTPGTAESYILTVLQARDSSGAVLSPSVQDTTCSGSPCFIVTLDGSNAVTFIKGMTSSGGSITAAGNTSNLRADAQSISVTNSGPAWGP